MKKTIRINLLERRNSLSRGERLTASRIITDRLRAIPDYRTARTIMFYVSFGSEVSTERLIEEALNKKCQVAVPRVIPESGEMKAILIHDPVQDLAPGFKGIREPELDPAHELSADRLDLVIVPGVAFDSAGNRLGMGKGYYDRFLKYLPPAARKIALSFESQIVDSIPGDDNDVRMDMIITDTRVIYCTGISN